MATTKTEKVEATGGVVVRPSRLLKKAERYRELRDRAKAIEEKMSAARDELLGLLGEGERVVLDSDAALVKEAYEEVDSSDQDRLRAAVDGAVAGGWEQCLERRFSVGRLHALEELHPGLKEAVPYLRRHKLAFRKP